MTYSRRSFITRCIAGYPTGRVITVEVEEERLQRASSIATHIQTNPFHREVCIRLTAWHCLSFPLPHFLLSEGGYGRERTSAKHKVDSYSTDWRKLICTYAPVAPTYKTYPTFFVTSPTRENSIGGATKWWEGDCATPVTSSSSHGACLVFLIATNAPNSTKTAIHNRIHSYLCVQERG